VTVALADETENLLIALWASRTDEVAIIINLAAGSFWAAFWYILGEYSLGALTLVSFIMATVWEQA
jgi:hypothetical protein